MITSSNNPTTENLALKLNRSNIACWGALSLALVADGLPGALHASDLIFNGGKRTVPGGIYTNIIVKNDAQIVINGNVTASTLVISGAGSKITINGNIVIDDLSLLQGNLSVVGATNHVADLKVYGQLTALGKWNCNNVSVASGGIVWVQPINNAIHESGRLKFSAKNLVIESGAKLDGNAAGRDARGEGNCWYRDSAGGGHVGIGGCGYWDSSRGGNEGQAFGSHSSYEYDMGGGGGSNGGAGVCLEATDKLEIAGAVLCDGGVTWGDVGGGAGGTILLKAKDVLVSGKLSVKGADAIGNGGGGGGGSGGRIKIFYANLPELNLTNIFYNGGAAGGYLNTLPGATGSFYRNQMPVISQILSPAPGEQISNKYVTFSFKIEDASAVQDGHADALTPLIEISQDDFKTVAYRFDQNTSLSGWERPVYFSGDTVKFTTAQPIPDGEYQWRVALKDRSVIGESGQPQTFNLVAEELRLVRTQLTNVDGALTLSMEVENGAGPFQIQRSRTVTGPWNNFRLPSIDRRIELPIGGSQGFFRASEVSQPIQARDFVVDSSKQAIATGAFNVLVIKNDGSLKVSGHLKANLLIIEGSASLLDVSGNLSVGEIKIREGRVTSRGTHNTVGNLQLSRGKLDALGIWECTTINITNNSQVNVIPIAANLQGSGRLKMISENLFLQSRSVLNGVGAGRDARGEGKCWYRDSSGGGHVGIGGCGFWDSSRGGNEGQPFGSMSTYEYDMGGGGGSNGGAGVSLEATGKMEIAGNILCDGGIAWGDVGGGAGGTILLKAHDLLINGKLSVRGASALGNGGAGGGGSGGRIKIFHQLPGININDSNMFYTGGASSGYRNALPGANGSFYKVQFNSW